MLQEFEILNSKLIERDKTMYWDINYCLVNFRIKQGEKNIDLRLVYAFETEDALEYIDSDTISNEDLEFVKDEFVSSEVECLCSNKLDYIVEYCDESIYKWNERHGCFKFWPYPNSLGKLIADKAYIEPNDIEEDAA